MQANNETREDFLRRTNSLAQAMGIDVGDVASLLSVSRATLFRYRAGKTRIPPNVLKKLGITEREAGIRASIQVSLASSKDADETDRILSTASLSERIQAYPTGSFIWTLEVEGAIFEVDLNLSDFIKNARELARLAKILGNETEGNTEAAKAAQALCKKVDWQARKIERMMQDFLQAISDIATRADKDATPGDLDET